MHQILTCGSSHARQRTFFVIGRGAPGIVGNATAAGMLEFCVKAALLESSLGR